MLMPSVSKQKVSKMLNRFKNRFGGGWLNASYMFCTPEQIKSGATDNFSRGLLFHVGAWAKTGLADSQMESVHLRLFNILGLFLGSVTRSYFVLY
jgi:hypothetical protein